MRTGSHKKLQYQYEVVRARLEIRDHYIRSITRDVYDNIGQLLSLVRVQLSVEELGKANPEETGKNKAGELLGLAVKELRDLCNRFARENELDNLGGFNLALQQELRKLYPGADFILTNAVSPASCTGGDKGLILFSILLNIFSLAAQRQGAIIVSLTLACISDQLRIDLEISGMPLKRDSYKKKQSGLEIFKKLDLLGGEIRFLRKKRINQCMRLIIPNN